MLCDKNSNIRTCDDYFYITRERPAMRRGPAGLHHVYRSKAGSRTNLRLRICEDTLGPLAGIPDCRQRRAVPPPASGLEGDLDSVKVKIFEYFGLVRLFEILNLNQNTRRSTCLRCVRPAPWTSETGSVRLEVHASPCGLVFAKRPECLLCQ